MRRRTFIIGFLIFDILAVLIAILLFAVIQPFKPSVAPNTDATTTTIAKPNSQYTVSRIEDIDTESYSMFLTMPGLVGMHEESEKTADGMFYTSFKAYLDLDMDGDGVLESVSIALDKPSESFYILVMKDGTAYDYVIPGTPYKYSDIYGTNVCKGGLRGFTVDLDESDNYLEVGVELMRETWDEYETIVVRFDGSQVQASEVRGFLSGVNNAGKAQFALYDEIYGEHKLFCTYKFTADRDFLSVETPYFVDVNVEKTSFMHNLSFDVVCTNLDGTEATITAGTQFYWLRTDDSTYVDVVTTDGYVYRLPIRSDVINYEDGEQTVFFLGDKYAAELYSN